MAVALVLCRLLHPVFLAEQVSRDAGRRGFCARLVLSLEAGQVLLAEDEGVLGQGIGGLAEGIQVEIVFLRDALVLH